MSHLVIVAVFMSQGEEYSCLPSTAMGVRFRFGVFKVVLRPMV